MFDIGTFRAKTCDHAGRRAFLHVGAELPWTLGLLSENDIAQAAAATRAKSIIFVWLWGAPSHIDTFDPFMVSCSDRGEVEILAMDTIWRLCRIAAT